ncbi:MULTISPECIES: helix-turn-helix domain-containing protein [Nocardiopsis]|uniref:Helix-turn-helix transcriptional regulator n=1 Tax=Nocardiopsis lambiniae TaxID=3075539 RepID=A0ABU2MGF1_9ACTN|nr:MULTISPECIES: helix-turn-helix transcriptional regulator [unclassified Nocardiopsis]MDE3721051.1 helix-turn-helix transcriptional regulator [Nocardiopsis sp. N85]MDT0331615.1 helix-turn-helix transcriptional regulator [Nocardiopsis sp. DSM 44743]
MGVNTVLPSAVWLPFGERILRARSDKGLSRAELAATVGVSDDKIGEVESARCRPARSLVERVDTALGTDHQLVDAWAVALQAEAFPNEFGDLRELTVHAPEVWETQPVVIPPFLRTREYSWAVLRPSYFDLSDTEVEAMVEEEMALRAAMTGPEGPSLRVVLNETVLRRPQGGADVLNAQRDFLADLVAAGIVRLGMIPEKSPRHPELGGPFRLMEYGDRAPIVYAFAAQGGELITDPEQVTRCSMVRDAIEEVTVELTPDSEVLTARWPEG